MEPNGDNSKENGDNGDVSQTNESDEGVIKSMIHDLMKSNYENLLSADRHLLKGKKEKIKSDVSERVKGESERDRVSECVKANSLLTVSLWNISLCVCSKRRSQRVRPQCSQANLGICFRILVIVSSKVSGRVRVSECVGASSPLTVSLWSISL